MEKLLKKEWLEELATRKEQVIAYRRHLHQHPELSFQEYETSQFIYDEMSKLENVEVTRPTATSVLVKITGGKPGKKIGLRADIDALPIQEQRDELDFKSVVDGKMHACGHDGHTAVLMVATMRKNCLPAAPRRWSPPDCSMISISSMGTICSQRCRWE